MSKYNSLLHTVYCEWVFAESNSVCGTSFRDMTSFTDHVRSGHLQRPPHSDTRTGSYEIQLSGVCHWSGCGFSTLSASSPDFDSHVLYHPYHSYLKVLGMETKEQRKLSSCQIDLSLSNLLPPLEVELQCQWDGGLCGVVFDSVGEFYRHVHDHVMSGKEYCCFWKDCSFKGRDRGKVNAHIQTHLKEKVVACSHCGSLFSNNTKYSDHLVRQQPPPVDGNFACSFCHKSFASERLLRDHSRRHVNTVQCPQCELTCQGPSRLLAHIRSRHMDSKPHECPLCHKTFKTSHTLSEHIESHQEATSTCTWPGCSFITGSARSWNRHVQTIHESASMLYCCHICNVRFGVGKKLTQHLKTLHEFQLPPGHCRFRYVAGVDGLKKLQTVRLDDVDHTHPITDCSQ